MQTVTRGIGCGALQAVISTYKNKTVQARSGIQDIIEIWATGTYAAPSGIDYVLGSGTIGAGGQVLIKVAIWQPVAGFVAKMHLRAGDTIRIYATDWHRENYRGRTQVVCTAQQIEVDKWAAREDSNDATAESIFSSLGQASENKDQPEVPLQQQSLEHPPAIPHDTLQPENSANELREACRRAGYDYFDILRQAGCTDLANMTPTQMQKAWDIYGDLPITW